MRQTFLHQFIANMFLFLLLASTSTSATAGTYTFWPYAAAGSSIHVGSFNLWIGSAYGSPWGWGYWRRSLYRTPHYPAPTLMQYQRLQQAAERLLAVKMQNYYAQNVAEIDRERVETEENEFRNFEKTNGPKTKSKPPEIKVLPKDNPEKHPVESLITKDKRVVVNYY